MKKKIIEHLKSAGITFAATFILTVLLMLQQDPEFNYFDRVAVLSLLTAGMRAGVKVVIDDVIPFVRLLLTKK